MATELAAGEPKEFVDELKPGTKLLQGQYTIVKFLNAGGFGITYLAKNSLDRQVVIKECFPSSFCRRSHGAVAARSRAHENEFAQIVKLFVQEAKSLSRLIHPNIVGVHQVFEDNTTAYMAIDYIEGRDLLEIIERDRVQLKPLDVVTMLKKLLGAVAFIHDNGMLHRDISPDNILVNRAGDPILIDFGAARQQATRIGGKALSALRVVKDGYSPQEFYITGSQQGPSSDLYALAASFFHAISGEPPPNSQTRLVAIAEHGRDTYVPLAGRIEGYPDGFLEALDDAISVLPKDRIQSAREWLERISSKHELKVVPLHQRGKAAKRAAQSSAETEMILNPVPRPSSKRPAVVLAPNKRPRKVAVAMLGILLAAGAGAYLAFEYITGHLAVAPVGVASAPDMPNAAADISGATSSGASAQAAAGVVWTESDPALDTVTVAATVAAARAGASANAFIAAYAATLPQQPPLAAAGTVPVDPMVAEARSATDPSIAARQVDSAVWSVSLPFETTPGGAAGSFPVIDVLDTATVWPAENAWIQEGAIIYAVNGNFVSDQAAIEEVVRAGAEIGPQPFAYVPAQIRASRNAPFQEVTLAYRATLRVALANGVEFEISDGGGQLRATVTSVESPELNGLEPGDVVTQELVSGEALSSPRALELAVDRLAREQRPAAVFAIERGGVPGVARMTLAQEN